MQTQNLSFGRYIFSAKVDWLIFAGPVALVLVIGGLATYFSQYFDQKPFFAIYFMTVLIVFDSAHTYLTFFYTYLDSVELRSRLRTYALLFFGLTIFWALVVGYSWHAALMIFALWSAHHFIMQQYGWIIIASRKNVNPLRSVAIVDTIAIFAMTVFPLLIAMSSRDEPSWQMPGDLFKLSPEFAPAFTMLFWLAFIGYLSFQVYIFAKFRVFYIAKWLVILSTAIVWYSNWVFFNKLIYFIPALFLINHAVPSIYLSVLYLKKNHARKNTPSRFYLLAPFAIAIVCGFVSVGIRHEAGWVSEVSSISAFLKFAIQTLAPSLLLATATLHYSIDSFFWKKKHNPRVAELFYRES